MCCAKKGNRCLMRYINTVLQVFGRIKNLGWAFMLKLITGIWCAFALKWVVKIRIIAIK